MTRTTKFHAGITSLLLFAIVGMSYSSADEPDVQQPPTEPGVFRGTMYYGLKGNVDAEINLRWTTDRQLVGTLMQGEHQQRLTNKPLGFVGSVQRLRGYAGKFRFCDVGIEEVAAPSKSQVIKTWPPGVGTMRLSYSSGRLSPGVIDGTSGRLLGQPPVDIAKPEKSARSVLPSDWETEKLLHGDWTVAGNDQEISRPQVYRFGPSLMSVITDGEVSSVMSYVSRPDLSSSVFDVIRFVDDAIDVSRMYFHIDGDTLQIAFGPAHSERPYSLDEGLGFTIVKLRRAKVQNQFGSNPCTPAEELLAGLRHDGSRLSTSEQRAILKRMLASKDAIDRGYLAVVCAAGHFGVTKSNARAKSLIAPSLISIQAKATSDDPLARFLLWRLAELGVLPEPEFDAADYLQSAAESGLPNAQWRLAKQHLRKQKQSELGYRWLIRAAPKDARAREDLAFWHRNERRKNRVAKDLAWTLTLAGARDGFSDLHTEISIDFEKGTRGKPDLDAAIAWCDSGSALGSHICTYNRGIHALNAKDYPKAITSFESASAKGDEDAKVRLADMYLQGRGVESNLLKVREILDGVDSREAKGMLAKIETDPEDGTLRLRRARSTWVGPSNSGSFNQVEYERNMRQLRSSMQQNIGRRTGVFLDN